MSQASDPLQEVRDTVDRLRTDFGDQAYLLFVAGLILSTGDYEQLMADSVLDGTDDKKIDLFHIDRETGRALVIQAYEPQNWQKINPPANKASDLNTASAWLLDAELDTITRADIRAAAEDLRDALESGDITELIFHFLHTSAPSSDVRTELHTVESSLKKKLESWSERAATSISCSAVELTINDVIELYEARHAAITITERIDLPTTQPSVVIQGGEWKGAFATVIASDLVNLADRYGESLTSANIRDYLGRRSSSRNINKQIGNTAKAEPRNFWVYNNGLTLITRRFTVQDSLLSCDGLAVTNGAQTLGSLSDVKDRSVLNEVQLPVRVIESDNPTLIEKIIRFNNTQNPIKPWELRVLDPVQMRIQEDFQTNLNITYQFRRGTGRSSVQHVHLSKLAPWLAAFNGDPIRAHRNSPELFENEKIYRSLFNGSTDVRHLLAVYRIGEAVGATKDRYRGLIKDEDATETQEQLYGFFRYGAFTTAVIYFASEVLLEIFGSGSSAKQNLRLVPTHENDRQLAIAHLQKLIEFTIAPIPAELIGPDSYARLRTEAGIATIKRRIQATVGQIRAVQEDILTSLVEGLELE